MKMREKKYLFEGFLNVLLIVMVSLATGFFIGTTVGIVAGIESVNTVTSELCLLEKMGYTITKQNGGI